MPARPLHFNVYIGPNGFHESAWRVADGDPRAALSLPYYTEIAQVAERGLLDAVFLADNLASPGYRVTHQPQTQFDPLVVLAALAGGTSRVGLIATGSTTYSSPRDLARRFATLDHLSGGRAGWNIVTTRSPLAAANFGLDRHPAHDDRYTRAHEFVAAVQRVWDSGDAAAGPRSPQGRPVLVQAGQSPAGIALAARYAELVFSDKPTLEAAVRYRAELRRQAAAADRDPDQVLVLPALMITLGATESAARKRVAELDELASPDFRGQNILYQAGLDPDAYDLDAPLPTALYEEPETPAPSARASRLFDAARRQPGLPLRALAAQLAARTSQARGFAGTPEQLADHLIAWQDAGAADGFTLLGSTLPRELRTFAAQVVPILQARGRFRAGYAGRTLRDHLGLTRPSPYPTTRSAIR